jgi:hypothetical protein
MTSPGVCRQARNSSIIGLNQEMDLALSSIVCRNLNSNKGSNQLLRINSSAPLSPSAPAAITKLGNFNNRNVLSRSFGRQKLKIRMSAL